MKAVLKFFGIAQALLFPGRTEAVLFQKAGHRAGEGIIAAAIEAGNERAEQQRANEADEHVLHGIVDARGQNTLQIAVSYTHLPDRPKTGPEPA